MLCRTDQNAGLGSLSALWPRVDTLGWLPDKQVPVLIQVGQAHRSPIVVETARSLAGFLADRLQGRVTVVDPRDNVDAWQLPFSDSFGAPSLQLAGIVASDPLTVPRFWFIPHFLVTVTGAGPKPASRISAVLDAQAEMLRYLGNNQFEALTYEAHRLAASDLAVVCGRADRAKWWVVGPDDVAVERVVARAAGIDPDKLPWLRVLASHELLDPMPDVLGSLPVLRGFAAWRWPATVYGHGSRVTAALRCVARDLRRARRNVRKVPGFLIRRLEKRGAA